MTPTSRLLCVILAAALPMLAEAQVCNLEKQSTISAPGNLARPQVVGDISYVAAAGSGIVRIDVSKPAQPAVLGSDDTDGPVRDMVYEFFENILVTAEESAGIGTYSIGSDSTTKIAVTDFGETIVFVDGVHSRFFAGSEQGTLFTVAINGENEPVEYGSVALGGEVLDVVFTSLRAYCALGSDKKIAIVDVSDHANPSLISYLPFGGDVTSLALEGGYLYAGVAGIGVKVLEVSDDSLIKLGTLALSNRPQDIVSHQDRLYITGPNLGLVVADISLAPHLIKFATLTLGGAAALDITGDRAHVGRGGQGYSIINAGDCGSTGFSPVTSVVAASARDVGGSGSYWVTDAAFANLGQEPASVIVEYLAKQTDNSNPDSVSFGLAPGQQYAVTDIYSELFGMDTANGALRITASYRDVKTTTKTYNAAGSEGTYGQFIPALTVSGAIGIGAPGGLPQLQENDDFRTNIGLVNLRDFDVKFTVHLYDTDGVKIGARTRTLKPYEMYQYNAIYTKVTNQDVDSGFAMVQVRTIGGQIFAYASVIDRGSNDPINIPAQLVTSGRPWLP